MLRPALTHGVLLAALVLATQTFVALGWLQPVEVSGDSMTPSLPPGERLLVRRTHAPQRWDTAVLRSPSDARRLLVKRVVGLPGEEIQLRGGRVWVDGERAPTGNSSPARGVYYGAPGNPTWRLGRDEWLVLGDNQPASVDSRNWDAPPGLPGRLIVGVASEPRN